MQVCRECDSLCTNCSGAGPGNCGPSNCVNASNDGICVRSCPIKKYLSLNGTCEFCPKSCGDVGCVLTMYNTSGGCGKPPCNTNGTEDKENITMLAAVSQVECSSCPYISIINGSRVCVTNCPTDQPIINASNHVCLEHCYQLISNINGTKFCSSECPNEKPFIYKKLSECREQCPLDTFVESELHNAPIKYCTDCPSECRRSGGKATCVNESTLIGSCLNGCKNFREDDFCVRFCTEHRVAVTEGPGHPINSHELSQKCVLLTGKVTTVMPTSTQSTTAVAPSANQSLAIQG